MCEISIANIISRFIKRRVEICIWNTPPLDATDAPAEVMPPDASHPDADKGLVGELG